MKLGEVPEDEDEGNADTQLSPEMKSAIVYVICEGNILRNGKSFRWYSRII